MGNFFSASSATNGQNPASLYTRQQRSESITSATPLIRHQSPQIDDPSSFFEQSQQPERPQSQHTLTGMLQSAEQDNPRLTGYTEIFTGPYAPIHDYLIHRAVLIEQTIKKLYEALEADIKRNAVKEKEIKETIDSGFCLFDEILQFKEVLFPEVQTVIHKLRIDSYKENAVENLNIIKRQLIEQHVRIAKNLPLSQSEWINYYNYLLDSIARIIPLVAVMLVVKSVLPVYAIVGSALTAELICFLIKVFMEREKLQGNNKNMYLKELEKLCTNTISTLNKTAYKVNFIKIQRETPQVQHEQMAATEQHFLNTAPTLPLEEISMDDLIYTIISKNPNSASKAHRVAIKNWLKETPSSEVAPGPSNPGLTSAVFAEHA